MNLRSHAPVWLLSLVLIYPRTPLFVLNAINVASCHPLTHSDNFWALRFLGNTDKSSSNKQAVEDYIWQVQYSGYNALNEPLY